MRHSSVPYGSAAWFATPEGQLKRHAQRTARRVKLFIPDMEPQSKRMRDPDRDAFQTEVLQQMQTYGRGAMRGQIALNIHLATTSKTAPQAHTIAKNLLDLLATRRATVPGEGRSVLYRDDSQIQALCVTCRHGAHQPRISIEARTLNALLDDFELATEAARELEMDDPSAWHERDRADDEISDLKALVTQEAASRARLGEALYESMVSMLRWSCQRDLLARSAADVAMLTWLYDRPKRQITGFTPDLWAGYLQTSTVRLQVGELPVAEGSSKAFRERIDAEIAAFRARWSWLIDPLVVPVALQVVVRPTPGTPKGVLHDLDNVVRDYLLPKVVPAFGTVTDHTWLIDFEELRRRDPEMADRWGPNPTPPKGTRDGVTRYEVWRLPPVEGEPGFVSAALVADLDGAPNNIDLADRQIERWRGRLDRRSHR
ncbi:MAG: hypothetical protein ACI9LT_000661 [Pseudoalteromonas distincta]